MDSIATKARPVIGDLSNAHAQNYLLLVFFGVYISRNEIILPNDRLYQSPIRGFSRSTTKVRVVWLVLDLFFNHSLQDIFIQGKVSYEPFEPCIFIFQLA